MEGKLLMLLSPRRNGLDSLFMEVRVFNVSETQPPLLLKKVSQYTSNLHVITPPICITVLAVPLRSEEREILSLLLPFVSQYTSHLYCNAPPIRVAVLSGKSWWLWSPGCSPMDHKWLHEWPQEWADECAHKNTHESAHESTHKG